MDVNFETINWLAVTACIVIGQVFMTLWFAVIFGAPWAKAFFITLFFCIATALPGYAFLKRWNAFILAIGSQSALILIISVILAIWK